MSLYDPGSGQWYATELSQWLEAGATSGQTQWWIQMVVSYAPIAKDLSGVTLGEAASFS